MNRLNVLYEDNHIIVVLKEPNILSQADSTNDIDLLTLTKNYIKEKYNKPGNVYLGLVHRLDRPVGGIMVFARTSKSAKRLNEAIKNHEVTKEYLLVCHGLIEKQGTYIDYIKKEKEKSLISDENSGKLAKLEFERLDYKNGLSLVRVHLITGRHHQIRLQFAHHGHFLYGDQLYGLQDRKQIALFAYHLSFMHPTKKEIMDFKIVPKGNIWNTFDIKNLL